MYQTVTPQLPLSVTSHQFSHDITETGKLSASHVFKFYGDFAPGQESHSFQDAELSTWKDRLLLPIMGIESSRCGPHSIV